MPRAKTWRKTVVNIDAGPTKRAVDAYVSEAAPGLVVHRSANGLGLQWRVTHAPTGLYTSIGARTLKGAKTAAREMAAVMSWTATTKEEIERTGTMKHINDQLRAIRERARTS